MEKYEEISKLSNFKNFLSEPKNKDVSCFSIWGGGGMARFFAYIRGVGAAADVYHYEVRCCVLMAHVWGSHLPKHAHF